MQTEILPSSPEAIDRAAALIRSGTAEAAMIPVEDGDGVRGTVPQRIRRNCSEDVSLMFRPAGVYRNSAAIVTCGGREILRKKAMIYTPGEMVSIPLTGDQIAALKGDTLTLSIERNA